jgi:hypothetical protein
MDKPLISSINYGQEEKSFLDYYAGIVNCFLVLDERLHQY